MKSILVAETRSELLATLEPILKHWGYRVLSTRKAEQVMTFLQESQPCLLIIGEQLYADPSLGLSADTIKKIKNAELPVIVLRQDGAGTIELSPSETLDVPVDLFELFAFIQRHVEKHPRQNLRLRLKLPGMYSTREHEFILAEVLSLSTQGLFFKAPTKIKPGDQITVVFPLFGHCKEIEVKSIVLYTVQPESDNNFFQGFGVIFEDIRDDHKEELRKFIKEHFLKEISASQNGVGEFVADQLKD